MARDLCFYCERCRKQIILENAYQYPESDRKRKYCEDCIKEIEADEEAAAINDPGCLIYAFLFTMAFLLFIMIFK